MKTLLCGTFARYAVWCAAIEDQPPEECVIGYILLGPRRAQTTTSTTVFPAHPRHVQNLASPVLALLKPAVASWKESLYYPLIHAEYYSAHSSLNIIE